MIKRIINDTKMMLYYHDYNNIFDIIKQLIIWINESIKAKS
jgi:hypothetical protein